MLLELSKLNKKLIVADALVTDILFELDVASLKFLASLTHVLDSSLVDVDEMSFSGLKFPSVTISHVSQFLSIVSFKLASQIVRSLKDSFHVLLSNFLAVKELSLGSVTLILHSLKSLLQAHVFSR